MQLSLTVKEVRMTEEGFFFCKIAVAKCSKQQRMGYMHFMVSCNSIR